MLAARTGERHVWEARVPHRDLFTGSAVLLFIPAGTAIWPAAWVYLVEMGLGGLATSLWLIKHDPALAAERFAPAIHEQQEPWDKILVFVTFILVSVWLAIMPLDAVRFELSRVPSWLQGVGALAILLSLYIGYRAYRENTFAAPVVRVQKERGQQVVTTGPYRYVRHPLYAGAIPYYLGTPLLLGSWIGLALAPTLIVLMGYRTVREERTLSAELPGYAEYAGRVRYRFVPLIW